jgi:hypothetical protein
LKKVEIAIIEKLILKEKIESMPLMQRKLFLIIKNSVVLIAT